MTSAGFKPYADNPSKNRALYLPCNNDIRFVNLRNDLKCIVLAINSIVNIHIFNYYKILCLSITKIPRLWRGFKNLVEQVVKRGTKCILGHSLHNLLCSYEQVVLRPFTLCKVIVFARKTRY